MIKEDYVSFEIAKLLKEKGFDSDEAGCNGGFYSERCYQYGYGVKTQSGQEVGIVYDDLTNSDLDYDEYLRPTLQMAMKWLREVHGIFIAINIVSNTTVTMEQRYYFFKPYKNRRIYNFPLDYSVQLYETYEQACEAAIKYCLENLI